MKIDRLVSIIMILLEKRRVSAQELADTFEVSLRTIYRDIDAIALSGIPVRAISGAGGGFEILSEYKVDNKVFSADDLASLLTALTALKSFSHAIDGKNAVSALSKIKSLIPSEQAKQIELKAKEIRIDAMPWQPAPLSALSVVKSAIEQHTLISFSYIDSHSRTTQRTAEPYQLVLKGAHWYVQAFCRLRADYRLFRLSRMVELKALAEQFAPRDFKAACLDYTQSDSHLQTSVQLRVKKTALDRLLEFCPYENITENGEEYVIADCPFIENDYCYDMLLSLGDKCECLAPPHVRDEIKRRITRMATLYELV